MIFVAGIDPGYGSGGISLVDPIARKLLYYASMPKFEGTIRQRVDQATNWFCEQLLVIATMVPAGAVLVLSIEDQHGAAFAANLEHKSGPNAVYVREVVGGIRRHCYIHSIPVRDINPVQWRSRLGLPTKATKKQAYLAVARLLGLPTQFANEHVRDSIVIAFTGTAAVAMWLEDWKRSQVA